MTASFSVSLVNIMNVKPLLVIDSLKRSILNYGKTELVKVDPFTVKHAKKHFILNSTAGMKFCEVVRE